MRGTRDAGDDREYRCRTRPLLVGPHQGQANRPGLGPGLHVRHAVSADLFDAIGLADRCGRAPGDDWPAQRTDPRLQVQVRLGAISRSIRSAVDRACARAAARLVARCHSRRHGHWIWWTVGFSFALGIVGATLDLVLDGWRITSVRPPEKQAVLSSWTEIGWRVGNLAAGAGALYLADHIGWKGAYLCMAALMLVGIVATLLAPEPPSDMEPHKPHAGFVETIWAPIHDLLKRLGPMAAAILLLVAGFRMPGYIASAMAVPLFKHPGFTNTDIATVTKVFGFWIALGGTFMAGWLIPRIGMTSSLLIGTVAGSASHIALALLAAHGGDGGKAFWTFALAVGVEGPAYAFASIVLITYMSTLAAVEHGASQFGLLTSLCAFPGSLLAGFSGFVIEHTGFVWFFIWTSVIGIPVAPLAWYVWYHVGISAAAPIQVEGGH